MTSRDAGGQSEPPSLRQSPSSIYVKPCLLRGHRLVAIFPAGGSAFRVGLRLRKSPDAATTGKFSYPPPYDRHP